MTEPKCEFESTINKHSVEDDEIQIDQNNDHKLQIDEPIQIDKDTIDNDEMKIDNEILQIDSKEIQVNDQKAENNVKIQNDNQIQVEIKTIYDDELEDMLKQQASTNEQSIVPFNDSIEKVQSDDSTDQSKNEERLRRRLERDLLFENFEDTFDEEANDQRQERESKLKRNYHNQKAYFDQRNDIESDASDIKSECSQSSERRFTLDDKMREMLTMFNESYVPYGLLHSSFFVNLLRRSYNIRKMPKLIQMKEFFEVTYELGTKYIKQTLSGAQSYTLIFEFWKSTNRRHQYITVRASYIDVFVRRMPVLTCFKVFYDWTSDRYIEKFNYFFKKFKLDRSKVFAVITNLKSKNFKSALEIYIGSEKIIYCLMSQLNCKFNDFFLDCDYEEDKIHYEEKLKPLEEIVEESNENDSNEEYRSDYEEDIFGLNDAPDDDQMNEDENDKYENADENQDELNKIEPIADDQLFLPDDENSELEINQTDKEDEESDELDDDLAYVKLFEEPKDVLKELNKQKINEMSPTIRVTKLLIKTYAYIASKENLLDELNNLTKEKNGQEFFTYFLLAYKNWNYLHRFLFYFRMVKDIAIDFFAKYPEIPFELNEHEIDILDDIFDLLSMIVKKLNMLSLEEDISLGKSLRIVKFFVKTLPKLESKTEEVNKLKSEMISYFEMKQGCFERDEHYSIASLLDPKCTKYDFKNEQAFMKAIKSLHTSLCYRLDKNFNFTLYRIRNPLRIEIQNFHKGRPYKGPNNITKFQLNSPVFVELAYDYFTIVAICFEPKKLEFDFRENVTQCLSQIRSDVLSKVLLLNSLDKDVFDRICDCAKFW